MKIFFNAFGPLYFKLNKNNLNTEIDLPVSIKTVRDLLKYYNLSDEEVEACFVNGKIVPFDTMLKDGDRVGLVPPGIPGPYRHLLGIRNSKERKS
ncbi:MoaD/ThiS family protein [Desulfonauticus submarinus]